MKCAWSRDTGVASAGHSGIEHCPREATEGKALCWVHAKTVEDEAMKVAARMNCLQCRAGAMNATFYGGGFCKEHS